MRGLLQYGIYADRSSSYLFGGLGNVAGDQLKAASDLGIPVIGIGLLYSQGYFRQMIDKDGNQYELYPFNDPGQLPIMPLRKPDGEWLRLEVALPGYSVWLRAWEAQVGRRKLYLLDTNDSANYPTHRGITSELYGGGPELRLQQEMLLGIGGWRLLQALNIEPEVCHLNEGHAAFAILERACTFMKKNGVSFKEALAATRAGNLFTTHTAVPAGFDLFSPSLMGQYLGKYSQKLGITFNELLALGRKNPGDANEFFNMAYLAMRGSGAVNGVSRLHGKVSRAIFSSLYPQWPEKEVPVGYVTNGVHAASWDSVEADNLWTNACGKTRWLGSIEKLKEGISSMSDSEIWQMRMVARKSLVEFVRTQLFRLVEMRGGSQEEIEKVKNIFDPNTLTLAFSRRFATYKRPNMLLHDPERLLRILTNSKRPVQLVIAGKAHPEDRPGKALIKEWIQFIERPEARPHVTFLTDDDMHLTEKLIQGADVWINTPRRPWEACGTSGMKVLVNGGINLSELDGWWAEAYTPEVGWAIGDGNEHGDDPAWDAAEAAKLYDLLEQEIVPCFYERNEKKMPTSWIARIRESMSKLTPYYSANRAVCQYTEQCYIPAASAYKERLKNNAARAKQLIAWQQTLIANWSALRFGSVEVETAGNQHNFKVVVYFNGLDPNGVQVELYAEGINREEPVRQTMVRVRQLQDVPNGYEYAASVSSDRPASDYTPRVIPRFEGAAIPLEADQILWQR